MADAFHWTCPFCDRANTVTEERSRTASADLHINNAEGNQRLVTIFIVCPHPECRRTSLMASLHHLSQDSFGRWQTGDRIRSWNLVPPSRAMAVPDYVPQAVREDYEEACTIRDASPKAAATLARRCLQGMIRDFWGAKPGRLVEEIEQIKDRTDSLTWEAIDAVRRVGNIGAHMEKDINIIVDVDPQEAELLIGLVETLIRDWYVAREERKRRLTELKRVADEKDALRKPQRAP